MQEKIQKISPIKQRILQFADNLGISKRQFYEKIGVSRGTLESNTGITEDIMAKFIAVFPDISPEWLLTGNGEMIKNPPIAKLCKVKGEGIPLISAETMDSFAHGEINLCEYECNHYIVPVFNEAEFLITVKGSSMVPKYNAGDIVACKNLPLNDLFFQWSKVYVLNTKQGALIKRVKEGQDNKHLLLVSDNERYQSFELPRNQIQSIALVIGVIRLE